MWLVHRIMLGSAARLGTQYYIKGFRIYPSGRSYKANSSQQEHILKTYYDGLIHLNTYWFYIKYIGLLTRKMWNIAYSVQFIKIFTENNEIKSCSSFCYGFHKGLNGLHNKQVMFYIILRALHSYLAFSFLQKEGTR